MKKLLSLIGAVLLFGISAANAAPITANFLFSGPTSGADAADYVTVMDWGDSYDYVNIDDNKMSFTYNTSNWNDYTNLSFSTKNPSEYKLNISVYAGMNLVDYQTFNGFGTYGSITPDSNDTEWTVMLDADESINGFNFMVEILPINGGGTGGGSQELTAALFFAAMEEEYYEDEPFYEYFNVTATGDTGSISGFDVNADYYPFTYTPSVTLTFKPNSNYLIEDIMLAHGQDYITDTQLAEVSASNGTWTLTLKEGLPDDLYIYVMVAPDTSKKVTLNIVNGEYNWISGYIDMKSQLTFPYGETTMTLSYTEGVKLYISFGDNDHKDFTITCANPSLTAGVQYEMTQTTLGGDPFTVITLGEDTPDEITFNFIFPIEGEKTATVNLVGLDQDSFLGTAWTQQSMEDIDFIQFVNNSATLTYTDFLGMTLYSEESDIVITCVTAGAKEGTDYVIEEGTDVNEGFWFVYLNGNTPDNIVFTVAPAIEASTVSIDFGGLAYKAGAVDVTNGQMEPVDIIDGAIEYTYVEEGYLNFEIVQSVVGTDAEYVLTFYCEGVQEGTDTYQVTQMGNFYYLTLYPGMNGKTLTVTLDSWTAIDSIINDEATEIYNLQGMRLNKGSKLNKGLYIINGKKVMVK
ncbi:MAG: hypothetical protein J1F43_02960 [Muribaculaceae bacterium]|nr:hypothetical protein [Muribaculaceae bacterium]